MLTLVAYQQAKKSGFRVDPDHAVRLAIEFIPPNRRNYDRDNLVAWIKSGLDGMADALGVNDRMFRLDGQTVSDQLGGMVKVRVAQ